MTEIPQSNQWQLLAVLNRCSCVAVRGTWAIQAELADGISGRKFVGLDVSSYHNYFFSLNTLAMAAGFIYVFPPSYDKWHNFFSLQHSSRPKSTVLPMCILILSSLTLFQNQEPLGAAELFILIWFTTGQVRVLLSLLPEQRPRQRANAALIIIFASKRLDLLCDIFRNKMQLQQKWSRKIG